MAVQAGNAREGVCADEGRLRPQRERRRTMNLREHGARGHTRATTAPLGQSISEGHRGSCATSTVGRTACGNNLAGCENRVYARWYLRETGRMELWPCGFDAIATTEPGAFQQTVAFTNPARRTRTRTTPGYYPRTPDTLISSAISAVYDSAYFDRHTVARLHLDSTAWANQFGTAGATISMTCDDQ
jgi:hypothetical protein